MDKLTQTPPRVYKCKEESFKLSGDTVGSVDVTVEFAWQTP
jgi:hypothetical protein